MRDDNDYSSMGRTELRKHLERVSKQIAAWADSGHRARADECRHYIDGVRNSTARAVTERKLDGEMHAEEFRREALEAEGMVAANEAIRDLLVVLIRTAEVD